MAPDASLNEVLNDAISHASRFDSEVDMFEATGTLLSLLFREPEPQLAIFRNLVQPILAQMEAGLQVYRNNPNPAITDTQAITAILTLHHDITALGHVAKGFPDMPTNPHEGYIPPPIPVFQQSVEAILVSLDTMNHIKIIRDAVSYLFDLKVFFERHFQARSSFSKIMAPAGAGVTNYIPQFMTRLIQQFESTELSDFLSFLSLLVHKLQLEMFSVLDELLTPLHEHIARLLRQTPNGAEEKTSQNDTRKAYMTFLNNIVLSKLQGVFTSDREFFSDCPLDEPDVNNLSGNKPEFERLIEMVMLIASDVSDAQSQKFAFQFLGRAISTWARLAQADGANGAITESIPGFEQFVYEHLLPLAFKAPSLPEFNIKDGQMVMVNLCMRSFFNFLTVFRYATK